LLHASTSLNVRFQAEAAQTSIQFLSYVLNQSRPPEPEYKSRRWKLPIWTVYDLQVVWVGALDPGVGLPPVIEQWPSTVRLSMIALSMLNLLPGRPAIVHCRILCPQALRKPTQTPVHNIRGLPDALLSVTMSTVEHIRDIMWSLLV
jgi:hypothetical protein